MGTSGGRGYAGLSDALKVCEKRGANFGQSEIRTTVLHIPHSTSSAGGHAHAQRSAFHHQPYWHPPDRSAAAPAADPWSGQTATDLHHRRASAISDDLACRFRGMWWQQCAFILAHTYTGRCSGPAWPGLLRRMDRCELVD